MLNKKKKKDKTIRLTKEESKVVLGQEETLTNKEKERMDFRKNWREFLGRRKELAVCEVCGFVIGKRPIGTSIKFHPECRKNRKKGKKKNEGK